MDEPDVGMFGLGNFGMPIAERLATQFSVLAYDPNVAGGQTLGRLRTAASASQVLTTCKIVVLCLPSPATCTDVVKSIAETAASPTRLIIELSTTGLAASAACAEIAARASVGYVDAPVSGNRPKAASGELTVMAAGATHDIEAAMPVLAVIAGHVFVLGERPGLGQVMKLANNMVNAAGFAVTCEAIVAGTRLGLEMEQMLEVLNVSTGRTSSSVDKFPKSVVPRTFSYGARGEIVHKDATLFLEAAETVGVHATVADAVEALWAAQVEAHPEIDFTNLYRFVENDEPIGDRAARD